MNWLIALYSAGLAQALLLILALSAIKVRNAFARWLLVALIALFALMLGEEFLELVGSDFKAGLGLTMEVAMGPLLYLFMRSIILPQIIPPKQFALHFLPFGLGFVLLVWLNLGFPDDGVSSSYPDMRRIIFAWVAFKIAYFFTYALAALRIPIPQSYSEKRQRTLRAVRLLFGLAIAAYALQAISFFLFVIGAPAVPDSDVVGAVLMSLSLLGLGYVIMLNRDVFDLRDPYDSDRLNADEAAAICSEAVAYLRSTSAFRDPGLDLATMSRAIAITPARLSQALNADGRGGFARLLNQMRMEAFVAAQAEPANRGRTVLDLALEAGFNSKATFYRTRAEMGVGSERARVSRNLVRRPV